MGKILEGKNWSLNLSNQEPGSSSTFTLSRHFNKQISSFGSWGIPGFNFSCALKEKSKYLFLVQKIFLLKWYWQNSFRNKTNIETKKKQKKLGFPLVFPPHSTKISGVYNFKTKANICFRNTNTFFLTSGLKCFST